MTDKFQDKSQVIEAELTPQDEEFLKEINQQILKFLEKDEEILEFDPMNSYQRRLVHQMGSYINSTVNQLVVGMSDMSVCSNHSHLEKCWRLRKNQKSPWIQLPERE